MAHAIGRGAAAVIFVLGLAYVLELSDSPAPLALAQPATEARLDPILVDHAPGTGREFFVSHQRIVPLGSPFIYLPILMYHYIQPQPSIRTDALGFKLSVPPEDFAAQLDWLEAAGYHAVDFNDVRAYFEGVRPLPGNPVVITLDDGYRDLYTAAFPILEAHHFKAVAYIVSSFVGQSRYVTRDELIEMDRAGIEIASHTVDHANLARLSYRSIMFEVAQSKRWLEQVLGHPVVDFAYPSGQFSLQAMLAVKAAGYDTAVTEQTSTVHSLDDRYAWARVRVGGGETLHDFILSLGPKMQSVVSTTVDVEAAAGDAAPSPAIGRPALRPGTE